MKSFLGNFYRYLAIFSGHTDCHSHIPRQSLPKSDFMFYFVTLNFLAATLYRLQSCNLNQGFESGYKHSHHTNQYPKYTSVITHLLCKRKMRFTADLLFCWFTKQVNLFLIAIYRSKATVYKPVKQEVSPRVPTSLYFSQ